MTELTYVAKNGTICKTYAEAIANGGVQTKCYSPTEEKANIFIPKSGDNRIKIK